ncbi:MAG TPA: hypothetical protein VLH08_18720 [Acidobacteriota bacterium]|nr:hypothetical protein [Acidobacteriota bacterium]
MKLKIFAILFLVLASTHFAHATSREMLEYVPQNTMFVIGADYDALRSSDVFVKLENEGRIWSFDKRNNLMPYLAALTLKPADIQASVFTKYLNPYGTKGEFHLFQVSRDISSHLSPKSSTPYLGSKLYRIHTEHEDLFATILTPQIVALGSLSGVKSAIDVMQGKGKHLKENPTVFGLIEKVPQTAGVWGISRPLSRREAASKGTNQSTNTMLESFENYYFYGIPSPVAVRANFIGFAKSEGEATFVRTFMIGMVTFSKFRAGNDRVADALDQITVDRNGKNIRVTAVVNQDLVNAYLNGEIGVE